MSEQSDFDKTRRDMDSERLLERIEAAKHAVSNEGRPDAVEQMHEQGALTARERVEYLCDDDTFDEIGQLAAPGPSTPETVDWTREDAPADGIITGIGEINGRPTSFGSFDFTVKGGSIGHTGFTKLRRILDLAMDNGYPVVLLHEGGGHRIQEGLDARPIAHGDYQGTFNMLAKLSGWVPLVSAIMGAGFAGPTNYASLCDFVPIVEDRGNMGMAGPPLVKAALGIDISADDYDARFHTVETGMAHRTYEDDEACLNGIKRYLSYFPRNANHNPPVADSKPPQREHADDLLTVVPADPKKGYDIHDIINGVVDQDSFFEFQSNFAQNIVVGFARIDGRPVGIVGNNPRIKAGTIDVSVTSKGPRFISLCDAFDIPLLFFADIPGFLPGPDQEKRGLARHAGKFLYELGRATTPVINVTVRRGYGFGYLAMAGGRNANQLKLVWPTTEIAGMSIEGAVNLVYRDEIEEADDPQAKREEIVEEFTSRTGPLRATEDMGVDAAIDPRDTRGIVSRVLERVERTDGDDLPPKKHGISPI
jgi:acetyl-CoA carboxylase carboxyltransferase component